MSKLRLYSRHLSRGYQKHPKSTENGDICTDLAGLRLQNLYKKIENLELPEYRLRIIAKPQYGCTHVETEITLTTSQLWLPK